ncbi:MAG: nucleoside-diphosphate kinase [Candidatus Diapherotrites archaeon]|uniref:Nucleoside diphosphate kinase n=1 Tax=Candidatus Iainarchaeum sp. TaxID=3101447 RepID=A0A8T3YKF5_9ARCH|nr:nucleoside-diphosphate kinase [Candidatus Diapherotrites archaeon]
MERTLVIVKPDAVNRGLIGEVVHRFERKGLKIIAMKMEHLSEKILEEHYAHLAAKPFFPSIRSFMRAAPSILMVIEGRNAVDVVRRMAGVTEGTEALPGTIRGDFSLSIQNTIIHASDGKDAAKIEIRRFFSDKELHEYTKVGSDMIYSENEKK